MLKSFQKKFSIKNFTKLNRLVFITLWFNPLSGNALYFIILLRLTSDYFTLSNVRRFYSSGGHLPMHPVNPLDGNAPYFIILLTA
jgi:hypothetical protein